ncbi:hypothetical protein HDU76_007325, partial [Blyttiomyces sp. JEL0837]
MATIMPSSSSSSALALASSVSQHSNNNNENNKTNNTTIPLHLPPELILNILLHLLYLDDGDPTAYDPTAPPPSLTTSQSQTICHPHASSSVISPIHLHKCLTVNYTWFLVASSLIWSQPNRFAEVDQRFVLKWVTIVEKIVLEEEGGNGVDSIEGNDRQRRDLVGGRKGPRKPRASKVAAAAAIAGLSPLRRSSRIRDRGQDHRQRGDVVDGDEEDEDQENEEDVIARLRWSRGLRRRLVTDEDEDGNGNDVDDERNESRQQQNASNIGISSVLSPPCSSSSKLMELGTTTSTTSTLGLPPMDKDSMERVKWRRRHYFQSIRVLDAEFISSPSLQTSLLKLCPNLDICLGYYDPSLTFLNAAVERGIESDNGNNDNDNDNKKINGTEITGGKKTRTDIVSTATKPFKVLHFMPHPPTQLLSTLSKLPSNTLQSLRLMHPLPSPTPSNSTTDEPDPNFTQATKSLFQLFKNQATTLRDLRLTFQPHAEIDGGDRRPESHPIFVNSLKALVDASPCGGADSEEDGAGFSLKSLTLDSAACFSFGVDVGIGLINGLQSLTLINWGGEGGAGGGGDGDQIDDGRNQGNPILTGTGGTGGNETRGLSTSPMISLARYFSSHTARNLTHLTIWGSCYISDETFRAIACGAKQLRSLSLLKVGGVRFSEALSGMVQECARLRRIHLSHLSGFFWEDGGGGAGGGSVWDGESTEVGTAGEVGTQVGSVGGGVASGGGGEGEGSSGGRSGEVVDSRVVAVAAGYAPPDVVVGCLQRMEYLRLDYLGLPKWLVDSWVVDHGDGDDAGSRLVESSSTSIPPKTRKWPHLRVLDLRNNPTLTLLSVRNLLSCVSRGEFPCLRVLRMDACQYKDEFGEGEYFGEVETEVETEMEVDGGDGEGGERFKGGGGGGSGSDLDDESDLELPESVSRRSHLARWDEWVALIREKRPLVDLVI